MKKLVLTGAALACAVSFVSAQVTSVNIVGYNKDVAAGAGYHISGYQFEGTDYTVAGVFGDQFALGTTVYTFNGGSYETSTYKEYLDEETFEMVTGWDPATLDLSGAAGFWVETVGPESAVLSGEVPLADSITTQIVEGFQLLAFPYPVERTILNLGFSPTLGDTVYAFNSGGYETSTYKEYLDEETFEMVTGWDPATLTLDVGQGFWYEAAAPSTWTATRPFAL